MGKMKLTFFGGVSEIGGNKILYRDEDVKILLDFGFSFSLQRKYFNKYLLPRSKSFLQDHYDLDIIPSIDGIYRDDLLMRDKLDGVMHRKHIEHFWNIGLKSYKQAVKEKSDKCVDGLLLSHAHLDHYGFIPLLDENITMNMSSITRTNLEVLEEIGVGKQNKDLLKVKKVGLEYLSSGYTPGEPRICEGEITPREVKTWDDDENFQISNQYITHFRVDHSVPGASAYSIESSDGRNIVYTGDLRFHGRDSHLSKQFIERASELEVEVLVTEGTRVDEDEPDSEERVEEMIKEEVIESSGVVYVGFSWKDLTRYETIKSVAEETGRTFLISPKTAYLLKKISKATSRFVDIEKEKNVDVYIPRKGSLIFSKGDYTRSKVFAGYSVDWKEDRLDHTHLENGLNAYDVSSEPEEYIVFMDFYDLVELIDIGDVPGSIYIRAQSEPFNQEMELDEERLINWLRKFRINDEQQNRPIQIHASGHACGPEIIDMIKYISPKYVIPVHTEKPEYFVDMLKYTDIDVELPALGDTVKS